MKYSVINKYQLNENLRMDSEYFLPEYMLVYDKLKEVKTEPLKNLCKFIKKGIFDISPELYKTEGIPLIRTTEIKNPLINFNTTVFLDKETHQQFFSTELESNDIVFTKIGANIGDVSLLPDNYAIYNFSQNVAGAKLLKDKNIYPEFLLCFFLSKYGNSQIKRAIMLSGQGKLELEDIRNFAIPSDYYRIKQLCKIMINKIKSLKNEVHNRYNDSSDLLLKELDLLNWQPKHELSYVKNFSDVSSANRYDAEYFQPKYDEIIEKIKLYPNGWDTIGNLFDQNRDSFIVKKDNKYKYIEIGSINTSNGEITFEEIQGNDLPANAKIKLHTSDILISKVRTYRGAVAVVENSDYIGSGAFTVLHEKLNSQINKETLYTFFKLKPILDLTLKYNTGTSYPTITDEDILNMPIPIFKQNIQNEIREKIQEAKKLQTQSKQLLEIAKRGVEIAIEENEEVATSWINEQLLTLGMNI